MEDLNKYYFRFSNIYIHTILAHLRTTWCKLLAIEKTNSNDHFIQLWTPLAHIVTFGHYLDKHQKVCKDILITISNRDKTLFLLVQIFTSIHFIKEEIMNYGILPTNEKDYWSKTLAHFTTLYSMRESVLRRPCGRNRIRDCGQHHPHFSSDECQPCLHKLKHKRCNLTP